MKKFAAVISLLTLISSLSVARDINIVPGAGSQGMGFSGVGYEDVYCVGLNPGLANLVKGRKLILTNESMIEGTTRNEVYYQQSIGERYGFFGGWSAKTIKDVEKYSEDNVSQGLSDYRETRATMGGSWQFSRKMSYGIALKMWDDTFEGNKIDSGLTGDMGLVGQISESLTGGIAITNITVPRDNTMSAGLSKSFEKIVFNADVNVPMYWMKPYTCLGLKYYPISYVGLKAGFRTGPEDLRYGLIDGVTAGLEFKYKWVRVDYAMYSTMDLGLNHKVSLVIEMPKIDIFPQTEEGAKEKSRKKIEVVEKKPTEDELPQISYKSEKSADDAMKKDVETKISKQTENAEDKDIQENYSYEYGKLREKYGEAKKKADYGDLVAAGKMIEEYENGVKELKAQINRKKESIKPKSQKDIEWIEFIADIKEMLRGNQYVAWEEVPEGVSLVLLKVESARMFSIGEETSRCYEEALSVMKKKPAYKMLVKFKGDEDIKSELKITFWYLQSEMAKVTVEPKIDKEYENASSKKKRKEVIIYKPTE
jgi:hypothetical protein